jgi:hypothetical protein
MWIPCGGGGKARQRGWLGDFAITEGMKDFQNFAPGGKGTSVVAFVLIHGFHESDFFIGIIALAGRWIDLAAPLSLVSSIVSLAAFHVDRKILLTAVSAAPVATPAVRDQHFRQTVFVVAHGIYLVGSANTGESSDLGSSSGRCCYLRILRNIKLLCLPAGV